VLIISKQWRTDGVCGVQSPPKFRSFTKAEPNSQVRGKYIRNNLISGPGSSVGIATGYGLDGPGIESRWGARFSAPVQTGPGAYPASCTMGTGSFPGVESGRGLKQSTAIPLLSLRAFVACKKCETYLQRNQNMGFVHLQIEWNP
jgi:hypothetical protein